MSYPPSPESKDLDPILRITHENFLLGEKLVLERPKRFDPDTQQGSDEVISRRPFSRVTNSRLVTELSFVKDVLQNTHVVPRKIENLTVILGEDDLDDNDDTPGHARPNSNPIIPSGPDNSLNFFFRYLGLNNPFDPNDTF